MISSRDGRCGRRGGNFRLAGRAVCARQSRASTVLRGGRARWGFLGATAALAAFATGPTRRSARRSSVLSVRVRTGPQTASSMKPAFRAYGRLCGIAVVRDGGRESLKCSGFHQRPRVDTALRVPLRAVAPGPRPGRDGTIGRLRSSSVGSSEEELTGRPSPNLSGPVVRAFTRLSYGTAVHANGRDEWGCAGLTAGVEAPLQ